MYWDAMAAITYVIGEKSCVSIEIVDGGGFVVEDVALDMKRTS